MIFNPVRLRDNGFSEEMIHYFMATSYDASRPMGNVAIAKIENCIFGVLLGRYESVEPMLPRAVGWIDQAISIQENFGKNLHFYRSRLYHARGVASWMLDGVPHEQDWDGARVSAEAAWRLGDRVWTRHEIVSGGGLDDYMAYSWLAGPDHWEAGLEMYEHWVGDQSKISISGNLSPKKFIYALLLDATARQPSSQEKLLAAGRRMLRENLQENWLGGGQGIRAATWLQIVYGVGEPGLTPSETLLGAYDDMPDVTSPF